MGKIKALIKKFFNKRAKKVKTPVVVFESDDWGSIRNSNSQNMQNVADKYGLTLDNYQRFDCLESDEDMQKLVEVLDSFENSKYEKPKFTLNYVMNNPDMEKCVKNEFKTIPMVNVTETYKNSSNSKNVVNIVKENCKTLRPQFHGYEHFNNNKYSIEIQKDGVDRYSFENNCIGINNHIYSNLDAFNDFNNSDDLITKLKTGLSQFYDTFGFRSKSAVFPCYVWNSKIEKVLPGEGVTVLQGKAVQNVPAGYDKYHKKFNFMGKKSKDGIVYLNRNVFFEPSRAYMDNVPCENFVDGILADMDYLIKRNIPVVVCSHRVNYVSGISREVRDYSLKCLKMVLNSLLRKYPDLTFMFSDELGKLYGN